MYMNLILYSGYMYCIFIPYICASDRAIDFVCIKITRSGDLYI